MPLAATSVTSSSFTLPARNLAMWILRAAFAQGGVGWGSVKAVVKHGRWVQLKAVRGHGAYTHHSPPATPPHTHPTPTHPPTHTHTHIHIPTYKHTTKHPPTWSIWPCTWAASKPSRSNSPARNSTWCRVAAPHRGPGNRVGGRCDEETTVAPCPLPLHGNSMQATSLRASLRLQGPANGAAAAARHRAEQGRGEQSRAADGREAGRGGRGGGGSQAKTMVSWWAGSTSRSRKSSAPGLSSCLRGAGGRRLTRVPAR
jgi:hypothetical protein